MRESCSKEQIKIASLSKNSGVRTRLIAKFLSATERSALVEKTSENFWNSLKESEKNYSLERLKVKWRQKKKKKTEQFDLCEKAVARKQIKIAPSSKDRKQLLREKLPTSDDKFPIKKIFNARTYYFSNVPELSLDVRMQRCLTCSDVTI